MVRNCAYGRLEEKTATLAQLRSYFEALPDEDNHQVRDVADLRRTLELYHTLVESVLLDDAFNLLLDRLLEVLLNALGAYTTIVELLTPLFPRGLAESPRLEYREQQASAVTLLSAAFGALEDWVQARQLIGLLLYHELRQLDLSYVSNALGMLGTTYLDEGRQLAAAERLFKLAGEMGLYACTGTWSAGEASYTSLMASPSEEVQADPYTYIDAARLRFGQGKDPTSLLDEALGLARRIRTLFAERQVQSLRGEIALSSGDLTKAEVAWQAAYSIALQEGIPLGHSLADLARLRCQQGQEPLARELISEALASGGLHVQLAAAEVYLAMGTQSKRSSTSILPMSRRGLRDHTRLPLS